MAFVICGGTDFRVCLALAGDPNLPTMQETALQTMARILAIARLLGERLTRTRALAAGS
jgi:hypothetical protein